MSKLWMETISRSKLKPLKPKILTFDAYNTLYSTRIPVMEQYNLVAKKYGVQTSPNTLTLKFPEAFKNIRKRYPLYGKNNSITPEQWWEHLIRDLFKPTELPDEMIREILNRFEGLEAYTVYPDVKAFLEMIKQKHPDVILAIISNTDPIVKRLLKNLQLKDYFGENIYLSYDLEIKKPDAAIFQYAINDIRSRHKESLQRYSIDELKASTWHVGDEKVTDLEGAYKAGLNSILVDRINEFAFFDEDIKNENIASRELSDSQLSLRKVCNDSESTLKTSLKVTTAVEVSSKQFVVTNFNSLQHLLFQQ